MNPTFSSSSTGSDKSPEVNFRPFLRAFNPLGTVAPAIEGCLGLRSNGDGDEEAAAAVVEVGVEGVSSDGDDGASFFFLATNAAMSSSTDTLYLIISP